MLVQEMHIDFDVKVQKVNSNNTDTFLKEEKDWLLNLSQYRLLRKFGSRKTNRRNEGGEDSFTRYADFEKLITRAQIPMYINTGADYVTGVLPYNFFDFREARAKVSYNCNGITPNISTVNRNHFYVPFVDSANTPTKFVGYTIKLVRNFLTLPTYENIFVLSDYQLNFNIPISSNEQKFMIVNHVLEIVNRRSDIEVRWENYGSIYKPNNFIFISKDATVEAIRITSDSANTDTPRTIIASTTNLDVVNTIQKTSACRLTENEALFDLLQHSFGRSIYTSPIITLSNGQINAYNSAKFIVSNLELDYIRKPRKINLSLNQSCELAESRHELVVDGAVQLATAYTNTETYKNIINENILNE